MSSIAEEENYKSNELPDFSQKPEAYVLGMLRHSEAALKLHIGSTFIPSCYMSEQDSQELLNITQYGKELRGKKEYRKRAHQTDVKLHPMDAGLGTSVKRSSYLRSLIGKVDRPFEEGKIGAKSQDLYDERFTLNRKRHLVRYESVADMKIRRILEVAKHYESCSIEVLVSEDSEGPMKMVYEKHKKFLEKKGIALAFVVEQSLPMIDTETNMIMLDHTSPGGHGYAGRVILDRIRMAPQEDSVHAIYNGDGFNNFVSPEMVGFTKEKKAAFTMITTTRTPADRKGGCIGGKMLEDGTIVPGIMELAQARDAGQEDLFDKLGLEEIDGQFSEVGGQYFNTNTVLMNGGLLHTFLNTVYREFGEDAYNIIVTPEHIKKPPKHSKDGLALISAEGALGSLVLRLAEQVQTDPQLQNIWKEVSGGSAFLQIVNLGPKDRDEFFTPIKTTMDYFLLTHTDHYISNKSRSKKVSTTPGEVVALGGDLVKDGYWANVKNAIDSLGYCRMSELISMEVHGAFICPNVEWRGKVEIHVPGTAENPTVLDRILLYQLLKDINISQHDIDYDVLIIENVRIRVNTEGGYDVTPLS